MRLSARQWGPVTGRAAIVCVHGVVQHSAIFEELGTQLASEGYRVLAVDLRGHGASEHLPPWSVGTHTSDILETLGTYDIERVTWLGHSFGGHLAARLAVERPDETDRLVLLDPGVAVPPHEALARAEIDRRDWSFVSIDGAVRALSSRAVIRSEDSERRVRLFAEQDLEEGPDGRLRFSFCPAAAVVAWSEMAAGAPEIAACPTLFVRPEVPLFSEHADPGCFDPADPVNVVAVKGGHNVLWEAPEETLSAVMEFVSASSP